MANLLDYAQSTKQSFVDLPLNELDVACLNELGYLTFGESLPADFDWQAFYPLAELVELAGQAALADLSYNFLVTPNRVALFEAVLTNPRFAGLELGYYINDISTEYERQFAAMIWRLPDIAYTQMIFRGTDDRLIGWKEDFNLSYMRLIPAQQAALTYLKDFLTQEPCQLVVSGHSKGGNLALYATSHLSVDLQDLVSQVYVFDAPGIHASVLASAGYETISQRVLALRPQESIVGVMLGSGLAYETVVSRQSGLLQHDLANWQVEADRFERADGLSQISLNLEKTFADWLTSYSKHDLKLFFDTCFDIFFTSGIDSLNDFTKPAGDTLKPLLATISRLDKTQRDFLTKAIGQLLGLYQKHALETAWANRPDYWGELLGKWQSRSAGQNPKPDSPPATPEQE